MNDPMNFMINNYTKAEFYNSSTHDIHKWEKKKNQDLPTKKKENKLDQENT